MFILLLEEDELTDLLEELSPLDSHVTGPLVPVNVFFITNSLARTVAQIDADLGKRAAKTREVLVRHATKMKMRVVTRPRPGGNLLRLFLTRGRG